MIIAGALLLKGFKMKTIKLIILALIVALVLKDAGIAPALFFGWLSYVVLFVGLSTVICFSNL